MLGREHAIGHPALTDQASGLANRLHFELVYSYLFEAGDRGVALAVMLVSVPETFLDDVEHVRALGEKLQETTRTADLVATLGHGRFVVLLLGTNLQGGRIAADRIEVAMSEVGVSTWSIGVAAYQRDMKDSSALLEAADGALRQAEGAGGGIELA